MPKNNERKNKESELERAKALIEGFCQAEYDSHADFSDLEKIDIAYTTLPEDEIPTRIKEKFPFQIEEDIPIQVSVDLIHCCISYFLNDKFLKIIRYENLDTLIRYGLESLDFDELIYAGLESI